MPPFEVEGLEIEQEETPELRSVQGIEIKVVTGRSLKHGLFDYESSNYNMQKFTLDKSCCFFTYGDGTNLYPHNEPLPEGLLMTDLYLSITRSAHSPDDYHVDCPALPRAPDAPPVYPLLVVRSLKKENGKEQRGYALTPGTQIRIGRVNYSVLEICTEFQNAPQGTLYDSFADELPMQVEIPLDNTADNNLGKDTTSCVCKICRRENTENMKMPDNLMLHLCKCAEGMHYSCVRKRATLNRKIMVTAGALSYRWRKFECSVCHSPYPNYIDYAGQQFPLLTIDRNYGPGVVLQKIRTQTKYTPKIVVLSFKKSLEVNIGRKKECNWRISHISVSKIHAFLRFQGGQFLIFDNDSKFGTCIQLNKAFPISKEKAAVQVDRTVFTLKKVG